MMSMKAWSNRSPSETMYGSVKLMNNFMPSLVHSFKLRSYFIYSGSMSLLKWNLNYRMSLWTSSCSVARRDLDTFEDSKADLEELCQIEACFKAPNSSRAHSCDELPVKLYFITGFLSLGSSQGVNPGTSKLSLKERWIRPSVVISSMLIEMGWASETSNFCFAVTEVILARYYFQNWATCSWGAASGYL